MDYFQRMLITIICESVLEEKIIADLKSHGVIGYTILEARGEGSRGLQSGDFEFSKNIKIEILCESETADAICDDIKRKYFSHYAAILYRSDVSVLREDKFK